MVSSRIQWWALTLSAYEYTIQYHQGTKIANADALSRLPLEDQPLDKDIPTPGDVNLLVQQLSDSIVTASQISTWTAEDIILSRVHHFIHHGWPDHCPDTSFQPFYSRRDELSTVEGCILWGARVVIPNAGRHIVLQQLHDTHPGINRMKSLA